MGRGLDCAVPTNDYAGCIKAAGYTFICRYLHVGSPNALTLGEAEHAAAEGLYIVSIRETNPTHAGFFTYAAGKFDGLEALRAAKECHQPTGTPIYFTVDYDASQDDLAAILKYFNGVRSVVMENYLVGVYGSGLVCATIKGGGWAHFSWLAMSRGWAGSQDYTDYDLLQTGGGEVCGLSVDFDTSNGDSGGWMPTDETA